MSVCHRPWRLQPESLDRVGSSRHLGPPRRLLGGSRGTPAVWRQAEGTLTSLGWSRRPVRHGLRTYERAASCRRPGSRPHRCAGISEADLPIPRDPCQKVAGARVMSQMPGERPSALRQSGIRLSLAPAESPTLAPARAVQRQMRDGLRRLRPKALRRRRACFRQTAPNPDGPEAAATDRPGGYGPRRLQRGRIHVVHEGQRWFILSRQCLYEQV